MNCWMEQRRRRIRRRKVIRVVLALAGAAAAASFAGILLPVEHRTIVRALLDRSPETVWRVLTDLDGMPLWRSDLRGVERLPDVDGRPAWRETSRRGTEIVELTDAEPPIRMVIRHRRDGGLALPELTFQLSADRGGTMVTVTERGAIRNPLGRVFVRLGARAGIARRFLQDLEQRVNLNRRQVAAEGIPARGN